MAVMLLVAYRLISGWLDYYYRPVMLGKRVAIHPILMMIAILPGVRSMGFLGFILRSGADGNPHYCL